jgi:hypothetical protein
MASFMRVAFSLRLTLTSLWQTMGTVTAYARHFAVGFGRIDSMIGLQEVQPIWIIQAYAFMRMVRLNKRGAVIKVEKF